MFLKNMLSKPKKITLGQDLLKISIVVYGNIYIYIYIYIYAKQFVFIGFIYIVSVFVLNPEQESLSTSSL